MILWAIVWGVCAVLAHLLLRWNFVRRFRKGLLQSAPTGWFCYLPLDRKLAGLILLATLPISFGLWLVLRPEPTALCQDGTYSYSRVDEGTCSGHGGVKKWINERRENQE